MKYDFIRYTTITIYLSNASHNHIVTLQISRRSPRVQCVRVGSGAGHDTYYNLRLGTSTRHVHRRHYQH